MACRSYTVFFPDRSSFARHISWLMRLIGIGRLLRKSNSLQFVLCDLASTTRNSTLLTHQQTQSSTIVTDELFMSWALGFGMCRVSLQVGASSADWAWWHLQSFVLLLSPLAAVTMIWLTLETRPHIIQFRALPFTIHYHSVVSMLRIINEWRDVTVASHSPERFDSIEAWIRFRYFVA